MQRHKHTRITFLHGLGGTPSHWTAVIENMPWADCSTPRLPWSWDDCYSWWGNLEAAEEAVSSATNGSDIVVAHSFATSVLINALGAGRIEQPQAVVFIAPLFRGSRKDFPFDEIERMLRTYQGCLAASISKRANRCTDIPDLWAMARVAKGALGSGAWSAFLHAYLSTAANLQLPSTHALIVKGMRDHVSPSGDARSLHEALPGSLLLIGNFGHFPMLERQHALADLLRRGLDELGVRTSYESVNHHDPFKEFI